jgi:hypothetical protein
MKCNAAQVKGVVFEMKGLKNVIYMSLALGMLFYSVPRLDFNEGLTVSTIFGIVWISMALLVIAAHLHAILGVDEEQTKARTQELVNSKAPSKSPN